MDVEKRRVKSGAIIHEIKVFFANEKHVDVFVDKHQKLEAEIQGENVEIHVSKNLTGIFELNLTPQQSQKMIVLGIKLFVGV